MNITPLSKNAAQEVAILAPSSDDDIVLSVNGVSKKFCRNLKLSLLYGMQDIASELVGSRGGHKNELRKQEFWALKDISFQLRRGEALGLVGKNGSGKSTILRVIAGLINPDAGTVTVNGRVAPLIALGAGFNPILTGRENIYANMSILGLTQKEIDERFEEVVEFAEIGEAIESPLQSYSSGMAARLGFASAIHTNPEILLIDEVLAVGDSRFRGKCFQKLHELRQNGTAFILVSHNAHSILTVCDEAVYFAKGHLKSMGPVASVMSHYEQDLFIDAEIDASLIGIPALKKRPTVGFDIQGIVFRDENNIVVEKPISGCATSIGIQAKVLDSLTNVSITIAIKGLTEGGEMMLSLNSFNDSIPIELLPGEYEIQLQMPYLGLKLGDYLMDVYVKKDKLFHLDAVESFRFTVEPGQDAIGRSLFYQPRSWNVFVAK
ncbi:ABC transporter ATP-binding protein [Phormidesmis sp. 146-35]